MSNDQDTQKFLSELQDRTPNEPEFHQAVEDVINDIMPVLNENSDYRSAAILQRLIEPDRTISFRVSWEDDEGNVRTNRGYRVQFNAAIGPYKGGLRFHPTVNQSILKFLGFEQTFKNALTGLPMGGAKGGSNFDPSNCSEREIMRFCTAFMTELHRHIGPDIDVPAGDINVGLREIGYLFGAYRRITNEFEGVLTGKGLTYGGSELRVGATGLGLIHFVCHMLEADNECFDGRRIAISGAGNVATHAAEQAIDMGSKVVTLSDSRGTIVKNDGLTRDDILWIRSHKSKPGASLETFTESHDAEWHEAAKPWSVECDIALPCATQNELDEDDARRLVDNGCTLIAEGANMPSTLAAAKFFRENDIRFGPAKAANAGGVAVSGLEISQNQMRRSRSRADISADLRSIMKVIHDKCAREGKAKDGRINYSRGANITAFRKLADAMVAQGF